MLTLVLMLLLGTAAPAPAEGLTNAQASRLEELGARLADDIAFGEGELLRNHFDDDRFVDRVMVGIELEGREAEELRRGMEEALAGQNVWQDIVGSNYSFLSLHEFEGERRPVFRLLLPGGGVNYHVLDTRFDDNGNVRIGDLYVFATGEWVSASVRRFVMPMIAQLDRSLIERFFSKAESDYLAHMGRVLAMQQQMVEEDHEGAVATYRTLPESLQVMKPVFVMYLSSLAGLEAQETEYKRELERFGKLFPGDPATNFMLVDYFMLNDEWKEFERTLDRLDGQVGGDPYIDVLRASGAMMRGEWKAAKRHARRAIEREPDLDDAHWALVTIGLGAGNHDLVASTLTHLRDELGWILDRESVVDDPLYEAFLGSPQAERVFGD